MGWLHIVTYNCLFSRKTLHWCLTFQARLMWGAVCVKIWKQLIFSKYWRCLVYIDDPDKLGGGGGRAPSDSDRSSGLSIYTKQRRHLLNIDCYWILTQTTPHRLGDLLVSAEANLQNWITVKNKWKGRLMTLTIYLALSFFILFGKYVIPF